MLPWMMVGWKGGDGDVDGGGIWSEDNGDKERLTLGPLTFLSLSLKIRSLSLWALSLREFLSKQCTRILKLV